MRKIAAHFLFSESNTLIKYPLITLNEEGAITDISFFNERIIEQPGVAFYSGVLCANFLCVDQSITNLYKVVDKRKLSSIESFNSYIKDVIARETFAVIFPDDNYLLELKTDFDSKHVSFPVSLGISELQFQGAQGLVQKLYTLSEKLNGISLQQLLQIATINAAILQNNSVDCGSISIGKTPGIIIIENIDYTEKKLTEKTIVKRLV